MPIKTLKQVQELIQRRRAELEEIDRRIRILEWLAKGQENKRPASAST